MSTAVAGEIADNNRFDVARLAAYLRYKIPGFGEAIEVKQFQGGQSNPTYLIRTTVGRYVMRKKPAGELLASAHRIDREYRIMAALHGVIPVPRMLHLCLDETVIGQAFYLMDHVEGQIAADARLIDIEPGERRALSLNLVEVLAQLHKADFKALDLEDYGRATGYLPRQLSRWSQQYAAARIEPNDHMDRVISWLQDNLPQSDECAIIHGDYRSYNVILAPGTTEVLAVLDWELSTIGHPLADLAYFCLPYYLPADDLRGLRGERPESLGLPSEDEIKAVYCRATGRSDLPDWRYMIVFSLFRSAAIRAGVLKRAHDGTASDSRALEMGQRYRGAAARAWELVQTGT